MVSLLVIAMTTLVSMLVMMVSMMMIALVFMMVFMVSMMMMMISLVSMVVYMVSMMMMMVHFDDGDDVDVDGDVLHDAGLTGGGSSINSLQAEIASRPLLHSTPALHCTRAQE